MINTNLKKIIFECCNKKKNEKIFILYDNYTKKVINDFTYFLDKQKIKYKTLLIENVKMHGQEPKSSEIDQSQKYEIVISIIKYSIAHTKYRYGLSKKNIKFLSLPYFSSDVLKNKAFNVNFKKETSRAKRIGKILSNCNHISLFSKNGTNFFYSKLDNIVNICPGWVYKKNIIASPPDIEVNIPLIGNNSHGLLIIDGSITCDEFGKLKKPISIKINKGKITEIKGYRSNILKKIFSKHTISKVKPAELGIGLNPMAKICGNMLIDEGSLGSIHIGFGSNSTIGGDKTIPFHLDHVIKKPTLYCDNQLVISNGKINIA